MPKTRSRLLVIDASIAFAAGDVSQHPTSRNCREFLIAFDNSPHDMVMTEPTRAEWDKHQTRFARRWRTSMMSRKRVRPLKIKAAHRRIACISHLEIGPKQIAAMEKDCHLIEAAIASDERIASLDDEVRALFRAHHASIPGVGKICWVNPDKPEEKAIHWLEEGAPAEQYRMLGHDPEASKKR